MREGHIDFDIPGEENLEEAPAETIASPVNGDGASEAGLGSDHNWSGWPGAWCLDCGCEDLREIGLAMGFGINAQGEPEPMPPEYTNKPCPEPGSNRYGYG